MKGKGQVSISTIQLVLQHYKDSYELMDQHVKSVMAAGTKSYVDRNLGRRTFWHWLYLAPWSEAFTKEKANDELRRYWHSYDGYLEELKYTEEENAHFCNIYYARDYLRSNCDFSEYFQSLDTLCAEKDNICLDISEVNSLNRFFQRIEDISKKEFPYSR